MPPSQRTKKISKIRAHPRLKFPIFASLRICVKFALLCNRRNSRSNRKRRCRKRNASPANVAPGTRRRTSRARPHRPDREPHSRFAGTHRRAGRKTETGFGGRTRAPAQGPGRRRPLRGPRFAKGTRRRAVRGDQAQGRRSDSTRRESNGIVISRVAPPSRILNFSSLPMGCPSTVAQGSASPRAERRDRAEDLSAAVGALAGVRNTLRSNPVSCPRRRRPGNETGTGLVLCPGPGESAYRSS